MKTSTKNAIISGIFTVSAAIIGIISFSIGKENQDNKIETTINQSGVITINQSENSIDTIERLLDEYISLQTDFNDMNIKYTELKNDFDTIKTENDNLFNQLTVLKEENVSLNNTLVVQKALEEDKTPEVIPDKYLFDEDPYMVEYVKLYMRNNDRNTIYSSDSFFMKQGSECLVII